MAIGGSAFCATFGQSWRELVASRIEHHRTALEPHLDGMTSPQPPGGAASVTGAGALRQWTDWLTDLASEVRPGPLFIRLLRLSSQGRLSPANPLALSPALVVGSPVLAALPQCIALLSGPDLQFPRPPGRQPHNTGCLAGGCRHWRACTSVPFVIFPSSLRSLCCALLAGCPLPLLASPASLSRSLSRSLPLLLARCPFAWLTLPVV